MSEQPPLFTIGYGARSVDELVAILAHYGIHYLGDIRSHPYSGFNPAFNRDALERHLSAAQIKYVYMGDTLGGDPEEARVKLPQRLNDDGVGSKHRILYDQVKELPAYQQGISRLEKAWEQSVGLVLMCSEGKPELCHRSRLIGATLEERLIPVQHIDERGELVGQHDVMLRINDGQATLPGMGPSPKAAKSSRSF